jgi:hypothetical protein
MKHLEKNTSERATVKRRSGEERQRERKAAKWKCEDLFS